MSAQQSRATAASANQATHDSLSALKLAAAELAGAGQTALVVCPDTGHARQLQADLDFLMGAGHCRLFPDWETLPYDRLEVAGRLTSQRLHCLSELLNGWRGLLLVTPSSLLQRLPPPSWLAGNCLNIGVGDEVGPDRLLERLIGAGYRRVNNVEAPGELAFRGAVLDFFPTGPQRPLRVEFVDDSVETMRWFDPATQLGTEPCERVDFFCGREFSLDDEALALFRHGFRSRFDLDETQSSLFNGICAGDPPNGSQYFLPLFFATTALLLDYLPNRQDHGSIPAILLPGAQQALKELRTLAKERYELLCHDNDHPLLPPAEIFADSKELTALGMQTVALNKLPERLRWRPFRGGRVPSPDALARWLSRRVNARVLLCARSEGALAEVQSRLKPTGDTLINPTGLPLLPDWRSFADGDDAFALALGPLRGAAYCTPEDGEGREIVVLGLSTGADGGWSQSPREQRQQQIAAAPSPEPENPLAVLEDLHPGALVVHQQHGLGLYKGLKTITVEQMRQEFATLEYRGGALLHLPVSDLRQISRYRTTAGEQPRLDQLGSERFSKARQKAQKKARDDAAELLELYAWRNAKGAQGMQVADAAFRRFCDQFPFAETEDQRRLTAQIRDKLAGNDPSSLLICGDVGFGKTEIAMRAAFIATMSGQQCCVLAPTTLLCHQHHERFRERFAGWKTQVARLDSTLNTSARRQLREQLDNQQVQLLISTHAVLRSNWQLPKLGLVVVDEEHRFGVADKEKIQNLQGGAHAISMTATPIPRTLNRSLSGLNDIAIMHEPPPGRLPIQTFVRPWQDDLVREAIRREQMRGGQIFMVHDRIDSIDDMAALVRELVPQVRLEVAHGRMPAMQLRRIMDSYNAGAIDLLLSTTIVESGIDVPNANTLVVTRADRMGLAQLHQLRGRVGRGDRQAWCWLLHPDPQAGMGSMSDDAMERLRAIERADTPGAGLALARDDLELRGAGDLLGREQSGHIERVGLDLYLSMLEEAVQDIRAGKGKRRKKPAQSCDVDLGDTALLPEAWMPDAWTRVQYYHRLSGVRRGNDVESIGNELQDRFGALPDEARCLLRNARLRIKAQKLGATRLLVQTDEVVLEMRDGALEPEIALALVQKHPGRIRLTPKSLRAARSSPLPEQAALWLLDSVAGQLDGQRGTRAAAQ